MPYPFFYPIYFGTDNVRLSIQASEFMNCTPKVSNLPLDLYSSMELHLTIDGECIDDVNYLDCQFYLRKDLEICRRIFQSQCEILCYVSVEDIQFLFHNLQCTYGVAYTE